MMPLRNWLSVVRIASALLGFAAVAGGVVTLFTIDSSAGSLFLVAVGIALILFAALGRRLRVESFEILGAKVNVREVIKSRIQLAQAPAAGQDDARAAAMRAQALALQEFYDLYAYIRRTEPVSSERTAALDRLVGRMRNASTDFRFDPAEVVTWFDEGSDPLRMIAISVMRAREDCQYFPVVLKAVDSPHSLMEQYHALRLGEEMVGKLDRLERRLFRDAITRAQRKRRFNRDGPLMAQSNAILSELSEHSSPSTRSTTRTPASKDRRLGP
jgi:hypothetical protein